MVQDSMAKSRYGCALDDPDIGVFCGILWIFVYRGQPDVADCEVGILGKPRCGF
jgi:hypothetical protein